MIAEMLVAFALLSNAQEKDCAAVARDLTAATEDARERASRAFAQCWGIRPLGAEEAGAVRKSVAMGNGTAVALLLLGLAGDEESRKVLEAKRAGGGSVKWDIDTQPVSEGLAASVALLRSRGNDVRAGVLQALEKPENAVARFFLDAVEYVEDREVLGRIGLLLDDTRRVPNEFRRRLCDYAVPRLVRRFGLKPSFEVRDFGRYSDAQLEEVRRLLRGTSR
ncbi:MAG: hypothetical protein JNK48_33210 [Bryobacterales bacterium]|nr:hypothetical protein [Bryobacterales bacterium]